MIVSLLPKFAKSRRNDMTPILGSFRNKIQIVRVGMDG